MRPELGHNLPPDVRKRLGDPVVGPHSMDKYPRKWSDRIVNNPKLEACCRQESNLTGYLYKTDPRLPDPDFFVAVCTCGRNHYRVALGSG